DVLRLIAPVAKGVTGWVRSEITPDREISRFSLGDSGHTAFLVVNASTAVLTVRDGIRGARQTVDRELWRIENKPEVVLSKPASPGRIYEVVYESADPPIAGLGPAAIRDLLSFLRYGGADSKELGDLHRFIRHTIAFG